MDNSAINIAVSNSLKDVVDGKVVVNGELQNMAEGWVVVNGVWKRVWPPTVAPARGAISGRYVKFDITSNWGDMWNAPTSLFVCDADGNKLNNESMTHTGSHLAYGTYASCSDTIIDNMGWLTYATDLPIWWKVDLGEVKNIYKIKIQTSNQFGPSYPERSIKDFKVSVSDDNSNWTEILNTQGAKTNDLQTFDLV